MSRPVIYRDWMYRFRKVCCSRSKQHTAYLFTVHFNVGHIVFKHSGHINLWKLIFTEDDEQTRLSTSTVTNNHQLLTDGGHSCTTQTTQPYTKPWKARDHYEFLHHNISRELTTVVRIRSLQKTFISLIVWTTITSFGFRSKMSARSLLNR